MSQPESLKDILDIMFNKTFAEKILEKGPFIDREKGIRDGKYLLNFILDYNYNDRILGQILKLYEERRFVLVLDERGKEDYILR